jgi:two-component system response regulator WspF
VKIGIVSERPDAVQTIERAVAHAATHQVIWIARAADDAVERCATTTPDLVLMDLTHSATSDGVDVVRRIMSSSPCPIVMVADSISVNPARVFEAMGHGALDAVDMPVDGAARLADATPLLAKIGTMARLGGRKAAPVTSVASPPPATERPTLVAIGASAGGPAALALLLSGLPQDFAGAIIIVQHVDAAFAAGMTEWLARHCSLPVRLAAKGDRPVAGTVLLAGSSDHLIVQDAERLAYTPRPREQVYRPSIDVFFHSANEKWRGDVIGVLLTGMGKDGADGLKSLRCRGHHTIAQDEASCAVYGMPKAAATIGAAAEILPLERIAPRLVDLVRVRDRSGSEN